MNKKDASFRADIKSLEQRLKKDPDSFCFARLSEMYLKVGQVNDALHAARTGVSKHPDYLAGQRALALACKASGLADESRVILEQVTAAMPEDVDAQKMLASLYVTVGDTASAIRTYRTVLDFMPDDKGCLDELKALQHGSDDEIIELLESDIVEEASEDEISLEIPPPVVGGVAPVHHDPLSTLTLAELYEKQGFLTKAREIYQSILADDPANAQLIAKIAQLEEPESVSEYIPEDSVTAGFDEEPDFSEPAACEAVLPPLESQYVEPVSESISGSAEQEFFAADAYEDMPIPLESKPFEPLAHKAADNIVDTLGVWLENIRRIKACR